MRNAVTGAPITGGNVNIGGKTYAVAFAEGLVEQTQWSHGMNLKSDTGGVFDWELTGSLVDYGKDLSRASTQTFDQAYNNGAGRLTSMTGTGWHTADAKGIWRPGVDLLGKHEVSFGFHHDLYELNNPVYNTTNWKSSDTGSIFSNAQGKTQTEAYWLQDAWDFNKQWNLTLGGRLENWHAFDGINTAIVGTALQTVSQGNRNDLEFSPKAKLTWKPADRVQIGAAIAQAYRFATATELFQTTTTSVGGIQNIINGNPGLRPEEALSSELSGQYTLDRGKVRLSLFQERVNDAIISQSALLANGSVFSSPQNVGEINTYGIEFSGESKDVGIQGLDLYGNATWADSRITENAAADAAAAKAGPTAANPNANQPSTGKRQPRVPEWRASATAVYRVTDAFNTSISGRYSSPQFGQMNNSDINPATYTSGGTEYFVVDLRGVYKLTKQFSIAAGIDNVTDQEYWLFHPFPGRTYFAELKFNY